MATGIDLNTRGGISMNQRMVWRSLWLLTALLWAPALWAQALDDVEVSGAGGQAEITIRFAAQVRDQCEPHQEAGPLLLSPAL